MKTLELLNQLENELNQLKDNIKRVKTFANENKGCYTQSHSSVLGELKHRCISLKSTLTRVGKISTYNMLEENKNN